MGARFNRLLGVCAISLLTGGGQLAAATPDLRLVNAAAEQDKVAIRALLKQGADVNAARADGVTALLWAAHFNDVETVSLLLAAGAKPNVADDHGVTPLAQACENANAAMADKLLAAGARATAALTSGLTPLMIATHTGALPVVTSLLAHGADVNAATLDTKETALMWAVSDQHQDIAQALIDHHADVRASSKKGFTPLMYAARNGGVEMATLLVGAGADVNQIADGTHVLPFAIISGQDEFARFLLEHGADPNGAIDGVRALHAAAGPVDVWLEDWTRRHGGGNVYSAGGGGGGRGPAPVRRAALVKALLTRGADANARITTSTMLMSYIGYPTKGAFEPFACGTGDLRGATPLWVAALAANGGVGGFGGDGGQQLDGTRSESSSSDVLRALLAAGADARITTNDGTTPLMVAAGLGRATFSPGLQRGRRSPNAEEAVTILLDAGAEINAVNEADFTALHGAAFRGLDEVIKILVDRGANINARDFRGRTAYRLAEGSKQSFQFQAYPETAEFLKKLGADTRLGVPGTVQERNRDVAAAAANQKP
jgi:ankyrin repeat protein